MKYFIFFTFSLNGAKQTKHKSRKDNKIFTELSKERLNNSRKHLFRNTFTFFLFNLRFGFQRQDLKIKNINFDKSQETYQIELKN